MTHPWIIAAKDALEAPHRPPTVHPWLDTALKREAEGLGGCPLHPDGHKQIIVPIVGPDGENDSLLAFDAAEYLGTDGYCMGDDDVSRTLALYGRWEPAESALFYDALRMTDGIVIDFGAQIGWYSVIAAKLGRELLAVEPIAEHRSLIRQNTQWSGSPEPEVTIANAWIDSCTPDLSAAEAPDIAMVKIDLEGNDLSAIRCLQDLIAAGNVANVLCEISPVFNDSYGFLVSLMLDSGYTAEVCNPHRVFSHSEIGEVLDEFPQCDVLFRRPQ